MARSPVWYVYGIVDASLDLHGAPAGLDETPVALEPGVGAEARMAALVSALDAERYDAAALERDTADVAWLSPRAVAHDRVLTWASDRGAVVPLPMFSAMFSGPHAVRTMLRDRSEIISAALDRAAAGREYVLRMHRADTELLAHITELSPRLAEMQRAAEEAPPGQRYLLERKLDAERKRELRSVARRVAHEVHDTLAARAVAATRTDADKTATRAQAHGAGESGSEAVTLTLDAAFLVASEEWPAFQRTLSELIERYRSRGFRFDFSGPWPPYHFVISSQDIDANDRGNDA
jgi:hypothetical protein